MDIIRTHLINWEGLYNLVIDGLQIKSVNAGTESLEDPMMTFLREVLDAIPCAAQMSAPLPMYGEKDPLKVYAELFTPDRFLRIPIEFESHLGVASTGEQSGSVYFPRFTWDEVCILNGWMHDLLFEDQPLLYLGMDEQKDMQLRDLLSRPWRNSAELKKEWFQAITEVVPVVLGGGHDESSYHAITRSEENLALLGGPIQRTARVIEDSDWYKENSSLLRWSDEAFEYCLILPCGKREHRRKC